MKKVHFFLLFRIFSSKMRGVAVLKCVKIQEFLNRKGFTQQQLADAIGVSREVVGKWNTQRSDVTRENCGRLLLAGMSLEEMFGDDVAKFVKKAILAESKVPDVSDEYCKNIVRRGLKLLTEDDF